MYTKLGTAQLKTGEEMEIGIVFAPDEEYKDRIIPLLGHKPDSFKRHIAQCLEKQLDELQTRYYIGQVKGEVITNIMTVEYNRTGILGHVYTLPEQRRKGACNLVMKEQMADFESRGGGLMLLGTGFDTHPYWIYHGFGFRSVEEGSGFMRYASEEDFEEKFFAPASVKVVEVQWKDWPRLHLLLSLEKVGVLRNFALSLYGITNFEGGFLDFKAELENDPNKQAKLLESERGAIVGCATVWPDRRWPGPNYILDFFMHPNFIVSASHLLDALELPQGKIVCYVDSRSDWKEILLKKLSFKQEAVLNKQIIWKQEILDVGVYSKFERRILLA